MLKTTPLAGLEQGFRMKLQNCVKAVLQGPKLCCPVLNHVKNQLIKWFTIGREKDLKVLF